MQNAKNATQNKMMDVSLMNKIKMDIWERVLDIDIVYDTYQGERVLDAQVDAFNIFMTESKRLFGLAEGEVKKYCLSINKEDIQESVITNIFKYVKPKAIYVKRNTGKDRIVALLCAYKFNPDDGIAIVFKNEKLLNIGTENDIL